MTPSQNVLVQEFRQILVWPFRLEGGRVTDPRGLRDEAAKALAGGGWTEIPRLLDHLGTAGDDQGAYQEFVSASYAITSITSAPPSPSSALP
jgi:hypothetical protein